MMQAEFAGERIVWQQQQDEATAQKKSDGAMQAALADLQREHAALRSECAEESDMCRQLPELADEITVWQKRCSMMQAEFAGERTVWQQQQDEATAQKKSDGAMEAALADLQQEHAALRSECAEKSDMCRQLPELADELADKCGAYEQESAWFQ